MRGGEKKPRFRSRCHSSALDAGPWATGARWIVPVPLCARRFLSRSAAPDPDSPPPGPAQPFSAAGAPRHSPRRPSLPCLGASLCSAKTRCLRAREEWGTHNRYRAHHPGTMVLPLRAGAWPVVAIPRESNQHRNFAAAVLLLVWRPLLRTAAALRRGWDHLPACAAQLLSGCLPAHLSAHLLPLHHPLAEGCCLLLLPRWPGQRYSLL